MILTATVSNVTSNQNESKWQANFVRWNVCFGCDSHYQRVSIGGYRSAVSSCFFFWNISASAIFLCENRWPFRPWNIASTQNSLTIANFKVGCFRYEIWSQTTNKNKFSHFDLDSFVGHWADDGNAAVMHRIFARFCGNWVPIVSSLDRSATRRRSRFSLKIVVTVVYWSIIVFITRHQLRHSHRCYWMRQPEVAQLSIQIQICPYSLSMIFEKFRTNVTSGFILRSVQFDELWRDRCDLHRRVVVILLIPSINLIRI